MAVWETAAPVALRRGHISWPLRAPGQPSPFVTEKRTWIHDFAICRNGGRPVSVLWALLSLASQSFPPTPYFLQNEQCSKCISNGLFTKKVRPTWSIQRQADKTLLLWISSRTAFVPIDQFPTGTNSLISSKTLPAHLDSNRTAMFTHQSQDRIGSNARCFSGTATVRWGASSPLR
jgi:hypothetical protein